MKKGPAMSNRTSRRKRTNHKHPAGNPAKAGRTVLDIAPPAPVDSPAKAGRALPEVVEPAPVRLVKPLPRRDTGARRGRQELAAVHAAYAASAGRIHALVTGWRPSSDGGVVQYLPDGTLLHHSGTPGEPFTAAITCKLGSAHTYPVATAQARDTARHHADACTQPHTDLDRLSRPLTAPELIRSGQYIAVLTLQQAKGSDR